MLTREDMQVLKAPFAPNDMEWRIEERTKKNGEKFTLTLAYLKESAILNRIEEVDLSWELSSPEISERGKQVYAVLNMTVKGVTRVGVGMEDVGHLDEAEKSAATDALKRVARLFGVGRYLLDLPKWADNEQGYAKWYAQQSGVTTGNAAPVDRGNLPVTETPFKKKQDAPTLEEHFDESHFPDDGTQETPATTLVKFLTRTNGKKYINIGEVNIFEPVLNKLFDKETLVNCGITADAEGERYLPHPVVVRWKPGNKGYKDFVSIRLADSAFEDLPAA